MGQPPRGEEKRGGERRKEKVVRGGPCGAAPAGEAKRKRAFALGPEEVEGERRP